jgi:Ca2+:H+ antiporter
MSSLQSETTLVSAHLEASPSNSPERSHAEPTLMASFKATATSSWLNLLLVFVPISWAIHFAKPDDDILIFICKSTRS